MKVKLNKQQQLTYDLLKEAGSLGINTKQFRSYLYIQMPTTRIFEINKIFKENQHLEKIEKRTEKDGTATFYLKPYSWLYSSLLDEDETTTSSPIATQKEDKKNPNKGRTIVYFDGQGNRGTVQI